MIRADEGVGSSQLAADDRLLRTVSVAAGVRYRPPLLAGKGLLDAGSRRTRILDFPFGGMGGSELAHLAIARTVPSSYDKVEGRKPHPLSP